MNAATPVIDEVAEFRKLCESHDLTYTYSSGRSYERGRAERLVILSFIPRIGRETAVAIWNETVDAKISEGSRHLFRWVV